jgi:hypothetical protein
MLATDLEISSLTLDEILSDIYIPLHSSEGEGRSESRLQRWCEICADADWEIFRKRLLRDGLLFEEVRARLGGVDRRPALPEPDWVADCRSVLRILKSGAGHEIAGTVDNAFGPLLAPLVATAVADVSKNPAYSDELLVSPGARADMVRQLWQRLVGLCELPFFRSLAEWKKSSAIADRTCDGRQPEFGEFVAHMQTKGSTLYSHHILRFFDFSRWSAGSGCWSAGSGWNVMPNLSIGSGVTVAHYPL